MRFTTTFQRSQRSGESSRIKHGQFSRIESRFAEAMAPIYEKYSGDLDVAAIYVEALMNLNPWQLWNKDTKTGKSLLSMIIRFSA